MENGFEGAIPSIRRRLIRWGRKNYQDYSWRSETDPWLMLVAEVLLQRTKAEQAERAFDNFRTAYPTAQSLVLAGEAAAAQVTMSLGLHWRGPLLYRLAEQVTAMGGQPPESMDALLKLPGVGPYASAAWLSLHRGKRAVLIDNNVARWLSRMTGESYNAETRRKRWLLVLADRLTPRRLFRVYNYAVLDFTRLICKPWAPRCDACPLKLLCVYGRTRDAH